MYQMRQLLGLFHRRHTRGLERRANQDRRRVLVGAATNRLRRRHDGQPGLQWRLAQMGAVLSGKDRRRLHGSQLPLHGPRRRLQDGVHTDRQGNICCVLS